MGRELLWGNASLEGTMLEGVKNKRKGAMQKVGIGEAVLISKRTIEANWIGNIYFAASSFGDSRRR